MVSLGSTLVSACGDDTTDHPAILDAGSAGNANAGSGGSAGRMTNDAAAGRRSAGAGGRIVDAGDATPPDGSPNAEPLDSGCVWIYDEPGCDGNVEPRCLPPGPGDACLSIGCSCNGITVFGGCGYFFEPYLLSDSALEPGEPCGSDAGDASPDGS
jgi:hypothetical protein